MRYWAFAAWLFFSWGLQIGCQEQPVDTPERNLERVTRLAQFCLGPVGQGGDTYRVMPPEWCSGADCPEGDETCDQKLAERRLMGLILGTARGEVALADLSSSKLLDLAPGQAGYGMVPVGEAPGDMASSPDGCISVVADTGDCALHVLSASGILAAYGVTMDSVDRPAVDRVHLMAGSGPLASAPRDVLVVPPRVGDATPTCDGLRPYEAYVSLPSCGLVARVDVTTGRILQTVAFGDDGQATDAGTDPVCPVECPGLGSARGSAARSRSMPGHLALVDFGSTGRPTTLLVGPDHGDWVAFVPVDPDGNFLPDQAQVVHLAPAREPVTGIRRIRVLGPTMEHDWLFAYVVTGAGDVRVLDLDQEVECETNPDPRDPIFQEPDWYENHLGCLPVGTVARAPLSEGPGIELLSRRQVVDAALAEVTEDQVDETLDPLDPSRLVGDFAVLLTLDGYAFLVNLDEMFHPADENHNGLSDAFEHRLQDGIYAVLSHQLRTTTDTREQEDGRARADEDSLGYLVAGQSAEVPPAGATISSVEVTDPRAALNETWQFLYEGELPNAAGTAGYVVKMSPTKDDPNTAEFVDESASFCSAGVRAGDILLIDGCDTDDDCPEGFTCLENHRQNAENGGICLEAAHADDRRVQQACLGLAEGRREYAILEARPQRLLLGVLPVPGTPCRDSGDCAKQGHDGAECQDGRCVLPCSDQEDTACADAGGVCVGDQCLTAPLPDQRVDLGTQITWCLPSMLSYHVRVRDAFLAKGSLTGVLETGTVDASGMCGPDPSRSELYHARLPLGSSTFENPIFRMEISDADPYLPPGREDGFTFDIVGGYSPASLALTFHVPAEAVSGADGYVYLLDMGDDTTVQGGVTGQVARIDPVTFVLDDSFLLR